LCLLRIKQTKPQKMELQIQQFSMALICERTILTERTPLVGEISANVCGGGATWSARWIPMTVISIFLTGAATVSNK
jgi:hypothetical protein